MEKQEMKFQFLKKEHIKIFERAAAKVNKTYRLEMKKSKCDNCTGGSQIVVLFQDVRSMYWLGREFAENLKKSEK